MSGDIQSRGPDAWRLHFFAGRGPETGKQRFVDRTVDGTECDAERMGASALGDGHFGALARWRVPEHLRLNDGRDNRGAAMVDAPADFGRDHQTPLTPVV